MSLLTIYLLNRLHYFLSLIHYNNIFRHFFVCFFPQ